MIFHRNGIQRVDSTVPRSHSYVRMTVARLWESSPLLLLASFVFTVLCAPACVLFLCGLFIPAIAVGTLTIPPAWAALLVLEAAVAQGSRANIGMLFRALPRLWSRSVALGLPASTLALIALFTLPLLTVPEASSVVLPGLVADASLAGVLVSLYLYAFPLLGLHNLSLCTALRNAAILASRHISNTLGLLGMAILFAMAICYLSSGLLFILPSVWGLFIVNNCRMVLDEELTPAEKLQNEPEQ